MDQIQELAAKRAISLSHDTIPYSSLAAQLLSIETSASLGLRYHRGAFNSPFTPTLLYRALKAAPELGSRVSISAGNSRVLSSRAVIATSDLITRSAGSCSEPFVALVTCVGAWVKH